MSTNQIYIQSRARLTAQFKKDGVLFNPQVILFSMWFTPKSVGKLVEQTSYQFGVDAAIVKTDTGLYYVERLFNEAGKVRCTWRSTAWGEEQTVEYIVDVLPRTVLEKV